MTSKLQMPEPFASDGPQAPLKINTIGWHLIVSDIHIPHFDKVVLERAFQEGKRKKVKSVFFNGDILDCHALSRHVKHKKAHDYSREVDLGDELMAYTRQQFPDAMIYFKKGNHEERMLVYMQEKAKELSELKALQLRNQLQFDKHRITEIEDRRVVRYGKLNIVHGHEFGPGGGVNPARWLFLKACQVVMCGHFHRTSEHFDRNMNDYHNACWSVGCMCDLHPFWNPLNKWNHGFATVELTGEDGGDFHVENHRVIKGKIV